MSENPLRALSGAGQSVWYDNIHREMLDSGELARMVEEDDLKGITSNPTIFEKAITGGTLYDAAISELLREQPELDVAELFNHLAVADIRDAADVMRAVHERTGQVDGKVSIEVSPALARDTEGTIEEGRRLYEWLGRSNVMIKVPATREGLPAIRQLISEGISVNVTLLFSVTRYRDVVEAFLAGLEDRLDRGESVSGISSVASFFVSRVDTAVDPRLENEAGDLRGKVAIANARVAYGHFLDIFDGPRFEHLRAAGAQEQRLLWASTGTKNPEYSDVLYVESLVGPRTVNTMPPATYDAFKDHGTVAAQLADHVTEAASVIDRVEAAGIDLSQVTDQLETDGVAAFLTSYNNLLAALDDKRAEVAGGMHAAG